MPVKKKKTTPDVRSPKQQQQPLQNQARDDEERRLYADARELLQKRPRTAEHIRQLRELKHRIDAVLRTKKKAASTPRYPTAHDQLHDDGVDVPGALARKREFAQMRQSSVAAAVSGEGDGGRRGSSGIEIIDRLANDRCQASEFNLARHQQFLANLVSPHTPYTGVLLFHGVGMGKTCTAVNIAEQFPSDTKVVVITQQALASNFRDTIFDASRIRLDPQTGLVDLVHASNQCTGTKYLDLVPDGDLSDKEAVRTRIASRISRRYRMFTTHIFAKHVRRKQKRFPDTWPQKLHDEFSNHVFVVDEAHKLRVDADKEDYRHVSQAMRDTLSVTSNVRLLLLTATPMYNEAPDILEMFNLMLVNDKMAPVSRAQIFDSDGGVVPGSGVSLLTRLSRAYVSYMRGGDPFAFPVRLSPVDVRDPDAMPPKDPRQPTKNAGGTTIPATERFRSTTLLRTAMSAYQASVYDEVHVRDDDDDNAKKRSDRPRLREAGDDEEEEEEEEDGAVDHRSINTRFMISTVVFPAPHPALATGSGGFNNCFVKRGGSGHMTLSYSHRCPLPGFLAPPHLDTFAPKVAAVVKRACRAEGVVFVFSRFIIMGALPLAVALEHMGFKRFGGTSMLAADPLAQKGWLDRMPPEWRRMRQVATERRWTYVVLSGDTHELSSSYAAEVRAARSKENLNGDVVKVVIATEKASEGMDLRNVREVHVMHPWFHQQKIEQIVGRSARMCSHISLPPAKRNVTVYLHACVRPEKRGGRETADVRAYRIAEMKQQRILDALRIISANAIDCHANREVQFYDPAELRLRLDIVSSQGVIIRNYALGDRLPAQPVTCATAAPSSSSAAKDKLDRSTYVPFLHVPDVRHCKSVFVKMFAKHPRKVAFTFQEVWQACRESREIQEDSVSVAIQEVLDDHTVIQDSRGRVGSVIYASNKYIFQPHDSFDTRDSLEERSGAEEHTEECDSAVFDMDAKTQSRDGEPEVNDATHALNRKQHVRVMTSRAEVSPAAVFRFVEDQYKVLRGVIVRHLTPFPSGDAAAEYVARTFRTVMVDFVVDRIPHPFQAKLVQEALSLKHRRRRSSKKPSPVEDDDIAELVMKSLEEGGVITASDQDQKKAVLRDPESGAETCVSASSSRVPETPENCVRSAAKTLSSAENASVRTQGYLLPPVGGSLAAFTRRIMTKARTVLEPGEKGVFKVLGDSRESSGFVCFQTSFVKSDDIAREVSKMSRDGGLRFDPSALRSSDKRSLCHIYEVSMRRVIPGAFMRPATAYRVFGRNPGKRRASSP